MILSHERKAPKILFICAYYNFQFDSAISYFESYKAILGSRPEMTKEIDMRINWLQ